jgi:Bacterial archaeo-eukaryotic release factor family 10/eRF1 domain 3
MITNQDLQELRSWKASNGGQILSLYVDRRTGTGFWNPEDVAPLVKGLLKELEPEVGAAHQESLAAAAQHAIRTFSDGGFRERSLVAFAEPGGRVWARDLNVPVASMARWNGEPYLLPLLEAVGEHPRLGVALVDRGRARLLTIFLGEIEEERDAFNPEPVKHVASTGADQAMTMNLQRRADEHAHLHLKHVASMLDAMARDKRFDRLILGGPAESAHRLRDLLPKRLADSIVGIVSVPVEAGKKEVLEAAVELERRLREQRNVEEVAELETASAKQAKAAAGLDDTLEALREGRVLTLLYAEGVSLRGRRCLNCGSLFEEAAERCRYCERETEPVDDLLDEMARRVARSGGHIEPVSAGAAQRLREMGGIGAFLRF